MFTVRINTMNTCIYDVSGIQLSCFMGDAAVEAYTELFQLDESDTIVESSLLESERQSDRSSLEQPLK